MIADAAKSADWWAVPEAIERFCAAGGSASGMAFWRTAAQAAGRSERSLRQMHQAYEFVSRFSRHLGEERVAAALRLPYSSLEAIVRIGGIDLDRALFLLANPGHARAVRDVREELSRLRQRSDAPTSTLVEGQQERGAAITFVARNLSDARRAGSSPPLRLVRWAADVPAVSPSLVSAADTPGGGRRVTAALVVAKAEQATIHRALGKAGWEATFFDAYWLAVPSTADPKLEALVSAYGVRNLGLGRFDLSTSTFTVSLEPTAEGPDPDRRSHVNLPLRHRR